MQKKLRAFVLCLKMNILHPGMWLFCVCMVLFLWLVHAITIPESAAPVGGLYCAQSDTAKRIADCLTKDFSQNVSFRIYEDAQLLREDVETGRLTCGFAFADDFEDAFWHGKLKKRVTSIETPFSNGTEVFKEAFYAALFREYSIRIIKDHMGDIFTEPSTERTDAILQANEENLSGEKLFTPEEVFVETAVEAEDGGSEDGISLQADIRGLFYLILFLLMLGMSGTLTRGGREGVIGALCPMDASFFRICSMVAGVLLPLIVGAAFLQVIGCGVPVWQEGLHLLGFMVYSCIWIEVLGRRIVRRECGTKLVSLTALHLLALPVLVDFASVFPPIRLLRYLLPVSVYLL